MAGGQWQLQRGRKFLFRSVAGPCVSAVRTRVFVLSLACVSHIHVMYFVLIRHFIQNPEKPTRKTLGLKERAHGPRTQPCTSLTRTCRGAWWRVRLWRPLPGAPSPPHIVLTAACLSEYGPLREVSLGAKRFASLKTVVQSAGMNACLESFQL